MMEIQEGFDSNSCQEWDKWDINVADTGEITEKKGELTEDVNSTIPLDSDDEPYLDDWLSHLAREKIKNLAIVRLKSSIISETCKIDEVHSLLKRRYGGKRNVDDDNDSKSNSTEVIFRNDSISYKDKTFYITICEITSRRIFIPGSREINNGEIRFYYWECTNSIKLFATLQSGYSNAWSMLIGDRDISFPKQFAKFFLDPKAIKETTGIYLTGKNSGTTTVSYIDFEKFDPSDVISRYGIIEQFKAKIRDNEIGKKLIELTTADKNYVVSILTGQVKLRINDESKIYKLLDFISESLTNKNLAEDSGDEWKFLTYIQSLSGKSTVKLQQQLSEDMFEVYKQNSTTVSSFGMHNSLIHQHQGAFNTSDVYLLHKGDPILWSNKSNDFIRKGEDILVEDIFNALRVKSSQVELKGRSDIAKIELQFYNTVTKNDEKSAFIDFLTFQILVGDGEVEPVFKHGKHWYKVELDTFLDTITRFANAVKNIMMPIQSAKLPLVLPWTTRDENIDQPAFKIEEMLKFAVPNDNVDEKLVIRVAEILKRPAPLLRKNVTTSDNLSDDHENNFLRKSDGLKEDVVETLSNHDDCLLDLNTVLLPNSEISRKIIAAAGNKPTGKKTSFLTEIGNLIQTNSTGAEIKKALIEFLAKKNNQYEKHSEKILEELYRDQPCLTDIDGKGNFIVKSPYLPINIWMELADSGICPAKLIQFMRMYTPMDEGDYNELYHLSNCKCTNSVSDWKYIVGDRILDQDSNSIELFDVMAYNINTRKEAYLLHVKKGFDGNAARAVCSQVQVCADQIWKNVTVHSTTDIFTKFFTTATKDTGSNSLHKYLTKREIENYIAKTEEEFKRKMLDKDIVFFICLAPCLKKDKNLKNISNSNLGVSFEKKIGLSNAELIKLKSLGILDKVHSSVTGKFFVTKKSFEDMMKREGIEKTRADQIYQVIDDGICGHQGNNMLLLNGSFIAKVTLIDLCRVFTDYFTLHSRQRVVLKIWEIEDTAVPKKTTERNKNATKAQTYISFGAESKDSRDTAVKQGEINSGNRNQIEDTAVPKKTIERNKNTTKAQTHISFAVESKDSRDTAVKQGETNSGNRKQIEDIAVPKKTTERNKNATKAQTYLSFATEPKDLRDTAVKQGETNPGRNQKETNFSPKVKTKRETPKKKTSIDPKQPIISKFFPKSSDEIVKDTSNSEKEKTKRKLDGDLTNVESIEKKKKGE